MDQEQDEQDEERERGEVERWTYLGQGPDGRYYWRTEQGQELAYKKLSSRVVGGVSEIEVNRTGERVVVYPDTRRYVGTTDAPDLADIQVRALRWERKRTAASLEKRTARLSEVDAAIEPLVALAAKVIGYANRAALADYVAAKIHGAKA